MNNQTGLVTVDDFIEEIPKKEEFSRITKKIDVKIYFDKTSIWNVNPKNPIGVDWEFVKTHPWVVSILINDNKMERKFFTNFADAENYYNKPKIGLL